MYRIEVDAGRNLVRLTLNGFWQIETVRAFATDEQAAVASLSCGKGEHLVLADLSHFTIQSQEVVSMCKAFIDGATNTAKRLALVAGPGLARIQYKRVMGRDHMQLFQTVAKAEAWLFQDIPAAIVTEPAIAGGAVRIGYSRRPISPKLSGRL
jgi:hypothetical protein